MPGTPIGRLKINVDGKKYSVMTVWRGEQGGYSLALDKDREGYPAMGPIDAMKAWAKGAYLDYWPERPREDRAEPRARKRRDPDPDPCNGDGFDDSDIPF